MTDATHPYDALMDITARPKAVFVRGAGSYLWDDRRKRYLDFVQGWAGLSTALATRRRSSRMRSPHRPGGC